MMENKGMPGGKKGRFLGMLLWAAFILPSAYGLYTGLFAFLSDGSRTYVGLSTYQWFLASGEGGHSVGQSALFGAAGLAGGLLLGGLLCWAVPLLRGRALRYAALMALSLPAFLPPGAWAACLPALIESGLSPALLYSLILSIQGAGIIGFFGGAYGLAMPGRGVGQGIGFSALLWCFFILSPDVDLGLIFGPTLPGEAMHTLSAYAFHMAHQYGDFGAAGAILGIKTLLQLSMGGLVCFGVYRIFIRGKVTPIDRVMRGRKEIPFRVWALPAGCVLVAGLLLFGTRLRFQPGDAPLPSLLPTLMAAAAGGLFSYGVALWILRTMENRSAKGAMILSGLLLALSAPLGGLTALMYDIGAMDTFLPAIVGAPFSPSFLMITLLCAAIYRENKSRAWLLAILPAQYGASYVWGGVAIWALSHRYGVAAPYGLVASGLLTPGGAISPLGYLGVLMPPLALWVLGNGAFRRYLGEARLT